MASFRSVLAGGRFVSGPGQLVSGRGDLFWPAAAWSSRGEPTSSKLFLFCRGVVKLVPAWASLEDTDEQQTFPIPYGCG